MVSSAAAEGSGGGEEAEEKFLAFDWTDERWQTYWKNLYPTPPISKVTRWKKKWYKQNIDPDFDVDSSIGEEQNDSSSSSSADDTKQNASSFPAASSTPSFRPSSSTSPSSSARQDSSSSSSFGNGGGSPSGSSSSSCCGTSPPPRASSTASTRWQLIGSCCHVAVLATSLVYVIPFLSEERAAKVYRSVLWSVIAAVAVEVFSKHGLPVWRSEWLRGVAMEYATQSLFFVLLGSLLPRNLLLLTPHIITSLLNICRTAIHYNHLLPAVARSQTIQSYAVKVDQQRFTLRQMRANLEVMAAIFLPVAILVEGFGGIASTFIYFNYIKMRYLQSPFTQTALRRLDAFLTTQTQSRWCPSFIGKGYCWVRDALWRSVVVS